MDQELSKTQYEAMVIGVSAGGLKALSTILPCLPERFPIPVMIVQHVHAHSDNYGVSLLSKKCRILVKEADEKESVKPGTVYLAPPNYHLLVEQNRTFSLSSEAPVHYARPSIDVLFETAADVYHDHLIGLILTGANADGSCGLQAIKAQGGLTIVQDPKTAEVPIMPNSAIQRVQVDHLLPLTEIGPFLVKLIEG